MTDALKTLDIFPHYCIEQIISRYTALQRGDGFVLCEGSDYLGEGSAFEFNLNQVAAARADIAHFLELAPDHPRAAEANEVLDYLKTLEAE